MLKLKLYTFGAPRLAHNGETIEINLRKAMALLVYLALKKGEHSRDELATMLWPESNQSSARANLRRTLYLINKAVSFDVITAEGENLRIQPDISLETDVETFRQSIWEAGIRKKKTEKLDSHRINLLEGAVEIYKNDFLKGFSLPDSPPFDEWQFFETESLRGALATVLTQLIDKYESKGDYEAAIPHARHLVAINQFDEKNHRLLMRLYVKSGQQAAALRQYKECVRILENELGVKPQPITEKLYQDIRLKRELVDPVPKAPHLEIKYVASGEIHIAYQTFGNGPVDIIFVSGFVTHIEQLFEEARLSAFFNELAKFSRVVLFDRRGVGLSDRVGYLPTLEDTLYDMLAVIHEVEAKRPILMGFVEGGSNSMLFAATYPKLISGLVLYGTSAKWIFSDDYPWAITREQYKLWISNIMDDWGQPLNIETYAPSHAHEPELREWWAKSMRMASSPGGIKGVLEVLQGIDVREVLPKIHTPTLIIHRKGDRVVRIGAARYLADQIPGAKYVELEGNDHWFFVGDTKPIIDEIRLFIQNLDSQIVPARKLHTILMIEKLDLDNKEGMTSEVQNKNDMIDEIISREVNRFQGTEVCWKNSRYTATFESPSTAILCAKTILGGTTADMIDLRICVHAGECEYIEGELVGVSVQIAEGILAETQPKEILVSNTVKDLVVGSGFNFKDRAICIIGGVNSRLVTYEVL